MAISVITVAQQKGGAGKTTLAAHLAAYWASAGRRVAALDIDPQGSFSAWAAIRAGVKTAPTIHVQQVQGWRLPGEIDKLKRSHDVVLIDSPPHGSLDARQAIRSADLVLVPVQLSPLDLWATATTINTARDERRKVALVLNRVPPRSNLSDVIRGQIAERGLPLTMATLGNRQVFAASLLEGLGATEAEPSSPAAEEVKSLAREIDAILTR